MKKILITFILSLFFSVCSFAEITKIDGDEVKLEGNYTGGVTKTCVDGYKFIIVRGPKSKGPETIAVTQAFEIVDGKSLPSKC